MIDVKFYFNFRSPYCYLASKTMWPIIDDYNVNMVWRPVGGYDLRSVPSRAKKKMPLARQDMARYARRLGIPVSPPPVDTEPTPAGAASLYAETEGKLREYIIETMRLEWAEARNIAEDDALREIARRIDLDPDALLNASKNENNLAQLERNAQEAEEDGVIGVPSFVIGEEIFWGQDRIDFVLEHLRELRASKV
ncbi:MAG: disulfide bond formation protein DsbA [Kordiimonas sp.]|nr:disulfide bond formation protein DsbA [Kordiimonas sp.]|tara:strand:- start:3033 stop:3617 length:585 start_codon:yes stop_codon:yes gene_type:complete